MAPSPPLILLIIIMFSLLFRPSTTTRFDMVIAQDGTGDFTTISQGLTAVTLIRLQTTTNAAAVSVSSPPPLYIRIAAGVYNEYVVIQPHHRNLFFIGDGMDTTIITGSRSHADGLTTHETATMTVNGDGFVAKDMTFRNAIGPEKEQGVALLTASTNTAFYRCKIIGFQDTLYVKDGVHFFRDCDVYGTVDFIFGAGKALFQTCNMLCLQPMQGQSNTVTAQGRTTATSDGGFVLHNCTISLPQAPVVVPVTTFLGRPWKEFALTVVMQSYLDGNVDPQGWLQWDDETPSLNTIYYAEYGNRGPGSAIDGRVKWKGFRVIGSDEASQFTVRRFINGDSWIPATGVPYFPDLIDDGFGSGTGTNYENPSYLFGHGFGSAASKIHTVWGILVILLSIWVAL